MTTHFGRDAIAGSCLQQESASGLGPVLFGSASVLRRICDPGIELAIWQRSLPGALARWIANLPVDRLPEGQVLVRPEEVTDALAPVFQTCRVPRGAMRALLLNDIAGLATLFARIAEVDRVDVRIEAVRHDSCKRFHRDYVPLRLLTTYRGPGTQWVLPSYAQQALAAQHDYAGRIRELPEQAVAIFRGVSETDERGIVHRSPPIAGRGITRLVLCLNGPSATSPEPWTRVSKRPAGQGMPHPDSNKPRGHENMDRP